MLHTIATTSALLSSLGVYSLLVTATSSTSASAASTPVVNVSPPCRPDVSFDLIYTDAHGNDPPSKNIQCGGDGTMPFWIQRAQFDQHGRKVTSPVDLTTQLCGAGYLSLHPWTKDLIFASMDLNNDGEEGNVETYKINLRGQEYPQTPSPFFKDLSPLLNACSGQPSCVEVSTFHGTFSPDGSRVFFAYRVWDQDGDGIGNQAIATSNFDGSNVKPLTFTQAGSYNGINIFDSCPSPTLDPSHLFFIRSIDQGMSSFAAVADVKTGDVEMLLTLPEYAPSSGCPNFVEQRGGLSVIYMGCPANGTAACSFSDDQRKSLFINVSRSDMRTTWGTANMGGSVGRVPSLGRPEMSPPGNTSIFYYGQVDVKGDPTDLVFKSLFMVPYTNTPDTIDSYAITQCDAIHNADVPDFISCEGADLTHSFFQYVLVNYTSGDPIPETTSYDTFRACMTPRCSLLSTTIMDHPHPGPHRPHGPHH